ncbi:class I SAM-dependent methyltransferase [Streptomyces buecherae]|uniref:class I SAM-dependent methyltransferase n=1 Tax=Streptomyces buecherae TaxID=2763006 RepID=UPI001E3DF970|nr:SAM-dependent methyltransferase [Streptomyces buecherae]
MTTTWEDFMQVGQPSLTARGAAALRAAHQELDGGVVFADPLAVAILGDYADDPLCAVAFEPGREPLRVSVAARSRCAEDALADAVRERAVRQVVVLGAGLDTFAYRNPHAASGVRVFEVDHPATHEWKRRQLLEAGIAVPDALTFAPIDFEESNLAEGLAAAGFDAGRPAFFMCLGVVPYLTAEAVAATFGFIASLPTGTEVVFDYGEPASALPPEQRALHERRAEWAAEQGEPFHSSFVPAELAERLRSWGFAETVDASFSELARRYVPDNAAAEALGETGGHVMRAWV